MFTNIFDDQNKMDCSSTNPKFIFLLATLRQTLIVTKTLIDNNLVDNSKIIYSSTFGIYFPLEPSDTNQLAKANIFYGTYSNTFSEIYFNLVNLWWTIQDERVASLTESHVELSKNDFEIIISNQLNKLEKITEDLKILK